MRSRLRSPWWGVGLSCALVAATATAPTSGFAAAGEAAAATATLPAELATGPLHYDGHFGGLRVADVTLSLAGGEASYETRMEIDARGVLGWFYTWHGELRASGALAHGRKPEPRSFVRSWEDTSDQGATVITYDDSGVALGIEDGQPQDQVPPHLRRNVLDPLAALVEMRRLVLLDRMGPARFPIYDGKRRLDLLAEIGAPKTVDLRGVSVEVVPVRAAIEPQAGFSDRQREGWQASTLYVLFTDDDRALPVQIRVHSPVGTAVMSLSCVETCV